MVVAAPRYGAIRKARKPRNKDMAGPHRHCRRWWRARLASHATLSRRLGTTWLREPQPPIHDSRRQHIQGLPPAKQVARSARATRCAEWCCSGRRCLAMIARRVAGWGALNRRVRRRSIFTRATMRFPHPAKPAEALPHPCGSSCVARRWSPCSRRAAAGFGCRIAARHRPCRDEASARKSQRRRGQAHPRARRRPLPSPAHRHFGC
jgi:hypothetical protein